MESDQSFVPVFMVTAGSNVEKLDAIQQEGVSAILDKPSEPSEVKRLIEISLSAY